MQSESDAASWDAASWDAASWDAVSWDAASWVDLLSDLPLLPVGHSAGFSGEHRNSVRQHANAPAEKHPLNPPVTVSQHIDNQQPGHNGHKSREMPVEALDGRQAFVGPLHFLAIGHRFYSKVELSRQRLAQEFALSVAADP
jgi:hypothetical protein